MLNMIKIYKCIWFSFMTNTQGNIFWTWSLKTILAEQAWKIYLCLTVGMYSLWRNLWPWWNHGTLHILSQIIIWEFFMENQIGYSMYTGLNRSTCSAFIHLTLSGYSFTNTSHITILCKYPININIPPFVTFNHNREMQTSKIQTRNSTFTTKWIAI